MKRDLHPHQRRAKLMLAESYRAGHRAIMLAAPCAFGKTVLMGDMVRCARAKGKRVLIIAPRIQLIDQTVKSLTDDGIDIREIGVIQGDHWQTDWSRPTQVASIQTLQLRKALPEFDICFIDEAHALYNFHIALLTREDLKDVLKVGLSATPWTHGLGKYYTDLVIPTPTQELIDAGFLSDFRVFTASHPDLSGVKVVAGDFHEGQLSTVMQAPQLTSDAVTAWKKLAEDRPTLCFAVDRAHGAALMERFNAAGVPTAYIDGNTPMPEREKIRLQLKHGQIKVVVNIGCLTMGCDWPEVSCLSINRPTKSEMLWVQIIGRGLRTAPGKIDCRILDHTDNTERLGFVTDIFHDRLHDGSDRATAKRREKVEKRELPTECMSCGAMRKARVTKCWSCGFEGRRPSKIVHANGQLKEANRKAKADPATKQFWWSSFRHYAEQRGKSEKWLLAQYKARFQVWPRGLRDVPVEPSAEVLGWLKHRQIAWAKSKHHHRRDGASAMRPVA